jgi:hypothetical protein
VRSRLALARLGYQEVRAAYQRHRQAGRSSFDALEDGTLPPSMEFVADWLREERWRILARARPTFLTALLVTIAAGAGFLLVLLLLA